MAHLFVPFRLRDLEIRNRVWVAPMCQYSAGGDGVPVDWHLVHLGSFAQGGFGLVLTEATAIDPVGRISARDTGLWNDEQADAWARIVAFAHSQGAAMGVQLAHAGRKASTYPHLPGFADGNLPAADGGWTPVGPTEAKGDGPGFTTDVHALDVDEIAGIVAGFVAAAQRADQAGFDVVEIHAAHGYLLHEFMSPLSNTRTDAFGGSFENRTRLLLQVVEAVREVWPHGKPLFVRISATDWRDDGWTIDDSATLAGQLRAAGVDLIDVSSGGLVNVAIPVAPGYQVELADRIRHAASIPTAAVGLITEPAQAEQIVADGHANAVLLGRQAMREPTWPLRAAAALGVPVAEAPYPPARWRGTWRTP